MRFIDYIGQGTRAGRPWNYSTTSAGTCSFTLSSTGTAYLIQGMTVYGGTLSNAAVHIHYNAGSTLFSGYCGSAGPIPFHFPLNIEASGYNTLSFAVLGADTGAINVYGYQAEINL